MVLTLLLFLFFGRSGGLLRQMILWLSCVRSYFVETSFVSL